MGRRAAVAIEPSAGIRERSDRCPRPPPRLRTDRTISRLTRPTFPSKKRRYGTTSTKCSPTAISSRTAHAQYHVPCSSTQESVNRLDGLADERVRLRSMCAAFRSPLRWMYAIAVPGIDTSIGAVRNLHAPSSARPSGDADLVPLVYDLSTGLSARTRPRLSTRLLLRFAIPVPSWHRRAATATTGPCNGASLRLIADAHRRSDAGAPAHHYNAFTCAYSDAEWYRSSAVAPRVRESTSQLSKGRNSSARDGSLRSWRVFASICRIRSRVTL